ncbi:MAG TPA: hypothetical protein VFC19_34945 [Candidatus Limnocylindrales bacterium]|nr:hypothetical protein [Candidatus Limnocylindrales bacterium]
MEARQWITLLTTVCAAAAVAAVTVLDLVGIDMLTDEQIEMLLSRVVSRVKPFRIETDGALPPQQGRGSPPDRQCQRSSNSPA